MLVQGATARKGILRLPEITLWLFIMSRSLLIDAIYPGYKLITRSLISFVYWYIVKTLHISHKVHRTHDFNVKITAGVNSVCTIEVGECTINLSHTLLGMWLLTHAGIKAIPCYYTGSLLDRRLTCLVKHCILIPREILIKQYQW